MASFGNVRELPGLLSLMVANNYAEAVNKSFPEEIQTVSSQCFELISKDYHIEKVQNDGGNLCGHYPPSLFIPWSPSSASFTAAELRSLISQAKYARCRTRFVVPAFSYQGKNICRSSTLSVALEVYGRQVAGAAGLSAVSNSVNECNVDDKTGLEDGRTIFSRIRDDDCELMKRFNVRYICDLMLEYRKVKYWLPVTSSEKADPDSRYHDFEVLPLPYPGSEFFRVWRDSGYQMKGLYFDWNQPLIEVTLRPEIIPKTILSANIDWLAYKNWDLTTITTNYLKLLLGILFEGAGGILLHCVSGWDRTPLFVSLIRCLLWADDLAHHSLSPSEMLYCTLAYDWFLFGHKLQTRIESGEEILRFAFSFLGEVASNPELSLHYGYDMIIPPDDPTPDEENPTQKFVQVRWSPSLLEARQKRLQDLSGLFLSLWDEIVTTAARSAMNGKVPEPGEAENTATTQPSASAPTSRRESLTTGQPFSSSVVSQLVMPD
ncbi:unnamed protein product [Calicophoron daubneyi]|uniref:Myotubularin-related protein 14 n=1 Tax=Calicophoron daubneyi TaxID=300641 RepID=A0AAV2TGI6_CALDB